MNNRKTELKKLKKAIYFCIAALITNLGLSSCGTKDANDINSEEEIEQEIVQETEIFSEYETKKNEKVLVENLEDLKENCILFQEVPEDIEYDEMSEPYLEGKFEVIKAEKNGISYLLDASDYHVIVSNYFSSGKVLFRDGKDVVVFLGIDGYDYTLDASNLRTVLEVKHAGIAEENKLFYLEGYGEVIESFVCGKRFLLDAETRYPITRSFDSKILKIEEH